MADLQNATDLYFVCTLYPEAQICDGSVDQIRENCRTVLPRQPQTLYRKTGEFGIWMCNVCANLGKASWCFGSWFWVGKSVYESWAAKGQGKVKLIWMFFRFRFRMERRQIWVPLSTSVFPIHRVTRVTQIICIPGLRSFYNVGEVRMSLGCHQSYFQPLKCPW